MITSENLVFQAQYIYLFIYLFSWGSDVFFRFSIFYISNHSNHDE